MKKSFISSGPGLNGSKLSVKDLLSFADSINSKGLIFLLKTCEELL